MTSGDLPLDSCGQFLAVAERWLIPRRARSIGHLLRRAGHQSVGLLLARIRLLVVMLGLGLLVLLVHPFLSHFFLLLSLKKFFRLGRVLRTTLPTKEGVVHLFVVYGYQGAEEDADQLQLTDKLLQAVLAEAQVVCLGQPMLIAGDLNADPAVNPCLAKGIASGRYVDLALAYSRWAGTAPDATCRFSREGGAGSRRDFIVGCPNALAASEFAL